MRAATLLKRDLSGPPVRLDQKVFEGVATSRAAVRISWSNTHDQYPEQIPTGVSELYVADVTPEAERYASFQHLELRVVGPLLEWLERRPTKLVVVGDPGRLDALGARLRARFDGRLFIAKSLPFFLELAHPDVSKGSGLQFVAERLGFTREQTIAFGDGENDLELIDWAGYSVAVGNAHPVVKARADLTCPSAEEEGVAQVLEAFLAR